MKRIAAMQLSEQSRQSTTDSVSTYLLVGGEPLFIDQAKMTVRQIAQAHGFTQRTAYAVSAQFDWTAVYEQCQGMSLFAEQQIIELTLPESGISAAIAKALLALIDYLHPDILLVILLPKLTPAQQKAKWYQQLQQHMLWVDCSDLKPAQYLGFIRQRIQNYQLTLTPTAIDQLAALYEGNLLALEQSLFKLTLFYPQQQRIDAEHLTAVFTQQANFSTYQWIDALLSGDSQRSLHILLQLENDAVEPILILRLLQKELFLLSQLQAKSAQQGLQQAFDALAVWRSKQALYRAALNRLPLQALGQCLQVLAQAECSLKMSSALSPWHSLQQITVIFCRTY